MNLEWGQIVTQMIGFVITVWLLKRFAWDKLLGILEERRQKIASSFDEIDTLKADAETQRAKYDKELENIEAIRRSKIQEAAQEANVLASGIQEEARRNALAMREKAHEDIEREIDKANAVLRNQIVDAVITTTEKVIREKLDRERHNKLIEGFLDEAKVK